MKTISMVGLGLLMMFSATQIEAIPSTLHIGPGVGTACATGCAGDPNVLLPNGSTLDIYQTSGGAGTITNLLLILAVPNMNDPTLFQNTAISLPTGSASLNSQVTTMTSGDVYTLLGLTGNNSNSFVNFAATEANLGITATSFGVYTFWLNGVSLGPKGLLDVDITGTGLPHGTIALAWSNLAVTPYTEAGVVGSPVPEPATLLLLGSGLVGLGGIAWRRNRK